MGEEDVDAVPRHRAERAAAGDREPNHEQLLRYNIA
jgi:hypothetical protein